MTEPVGDPTAALPVTTALSWLVFPSTMLVCVGVVAVEEDALPTSKHSSVLVSELAE